MKRRSTHRMLFLALVTAYMALLAHVFVPHHHHGEHTAYLNHKTCPHELHDAHDHHSHSEHTSGGDCETLKNVLVNGSEQKGNIHTAPESVDLNHFLLPAFSVTVEDLILVRIIRDKNHPIGYYSYTLASNSLRGPPVIT